jgi:hypothetical protein
LNVENKELINKADMVLTDLATAGHLNPEQSDRFIRTLIDQPTLLAVSRTVAMGTPEMRINKIGFGSRIMRPAAEYTAVADADRVKPDLGQVKLTTNELIAEIHLPYDVIEDNIEKGNVNVPLQTGAGGLHQTIVDLIAERAALDLEELAIKGDTSVVGTDAYLGVCDGYLKLATANVCNIGGAFDKNAVKTALKTMPYRYLRNRSALQHFVSVDNETEVRDMYASRQTAQGDSNLQGQNSIYVFGSAIKPVALMPGDQGLFCDPMNLIFGIQRNIMIEYTKDIQKRVFIIVLTCRVAFQIEEINACTKYTGLTGSRA